MRLLLVDDDADFAGMLRAALAHRDITADVAHTAADAELLLSTTLFAAVILDLGLPDDEGTALVRRWRAGGHSEPILVVSGRDGVVARVAALRAGADDYLLKPFFVDELHARIDAIVRRRDGFSDPSIHAGALTFDTMSRQLSIDGAAIELSSREADLAEILIRRNNRATPRRLLEDQLFGPGDGVTSNALEVYVHRLRRKIESQSDVSIRTLRGIGYMLVAR
ncbi:response regulator [Sphingomonas sp. CL5.1]|uniref:response regulator n=1 Tax=Sphingomonas sp. CL5.1 TaxID=2653203 RepID=UPI001581D1C6|nr:response regulator [Sphingomonas sp. CL5.1]QKS00508.1 response regulator [Sphingomonas sp. CL5.1]